MQTRQHGASSSGMDGRFTDIGGTLGRRRMTTSAPHPPYLFVSQTTSAAIAMPTKNIGSSPNVVHPVPRRRGQEQSSPAALVAVPVCRFSSAVHKVVLLRLCHHDYVLRVRYGPLVPLMHVTQGGPGRKHESETQSCTFGLQGNTEKSMVFALYSANAHPTCKSLNEALKPLSRSTV
jgi:hypothetical protein